MAANDCSRLQFFDVTETDFYFEDTGSDTNLVTDALQMSIHPVKQLWIRSNDNKFLILNYEEEFQAQTLNTEQQRQPENKFNFQIYKDSSLSGKKGRAIMLYAEKDGKKMVVCCNEKHEVYPVKMDIPRYIEASEDKAVFYLTELSASRYMLESSKYLSQFLGFEPDGNRPSVSKLVLRHKGRDEVDESCEVICS